MLNKMRKITQLVQQNIENSYPIMNFGSPLLEGRFPLSCNTVSLFHQYLKYAVYCQCDDFLFTVSLTHSALKYLFLISYPSKTRLKSSFYLGPMTSSFTRASGLAPHCQHQPRKTVTTQSP